ncbi:hypothetical protein CSB45_11390 [candidate division KSB3 bacterium]|uniref:Phosphodiester glycosidase domain-containing protein n=1 Tax=candidate division KSB3 bacterium TaxID=2044937 RepID=A0A2G6E3U0_9BACT|nr:MAG: hypothetical protein CSB45_11390 [candidate division KSB3 bacterium]PIE28916.1 MAG: hypothetical protein CSA57_11440 [candidate division KSB3 bacterium]
MPTLFRALKFFLLFVLLVSLSYVTVMFLRGDDDFWWLVVRRKYTVETFLENLRQGNNSPKIEHKRMYALLKHLRPERLGNVSPSSPLPYDYAFFFKELVPTFFAPQESAGRGGIAADKNILESFRPAEDYVAKLLLLSGPDSQIIAGSRTLEGYPRRLEMTATYSSEFNFPSGLFVLDGELLNPVLQKWNGLAILDKHGRFYIKDLNALEYAFRRFDISHSYRDYLDFLELAQEEELSIFQTHLLIHNGRIAVSPDSRRRARRRAIVLDRSQTILIYDSFDWQASLYEMSELLKQRYDAVEAINLDMGPFGYAARYEDGRRKEIYLGKGRHVELSNILVFHYH